MAKIFITFGQIHVHKINDHTLDRDCVAIINGSTVEEADKLAFEWMEGKFHEHVPEQYWDDEDMKYYPRGYIEVNPTIGDNNGN